MSTVSLNSPEALKWAKAVVRHYGDWSAVRAVSKRNADGVWQVPWPPNYDGECDGDRDDRNNGVRAAA